MELLLVEMPTPLLWSSGSDHIFIVGLRMATFYKADRLLRQFQYKQGMPSGKRRTPLTPVDQSFVKVHFHRMTTEYSNWLVDKIVGKEIEMVAMRK